MWVSSFKSARNYNGLCETGGLDVVKDRGMGMGKGKGCKCPGEEDQGRGELMQTGTHVDGPRPPLCQ